MNSRRGRAWFSSLASLQVLLAAGAWPQGVSPGEVERAEHQETEDLFREIERRLGRIDERLQEAGDTAASGGTAEGLHATRSDGAFVLSSMDRLLEIQVHHSGPGG